MKPSPVAPNQAQGRMVSAARISCSKREGRGVVVDADVVIDDGIGRITGDTQSRAERKNRLPTQ